MKEMYGVSASSVNTQLNLNPIGEASRNRKSNNL